MKIILKLDIKYLGIKNDIIDVKPGYARNYLIPKKTWYIFIPLPSYWTLIRM